MTFKTAFRKRTRLHALMVEAKKQRARVRRLRAAAIALAETPYGNAVAALGTDEPSRVGQKIADAIRKLKI